MPETVLGQLGNRVQHALRAYTPRDQKAVKAAAETMRANPKLDTEKAITELGVGEALVSFLDAKGRPEMVERAFILPPGGRIGPATPEERQRVIAGFRTWRHLRQGSRSRIRVRAAQGTRASARRLRRRRRAPQGGSWTDSIKDSLGGLISGSGRKDSIVEAVAKSAARTVGSTIGREIVRGVLGSLLGWTSAARRGIGAAGRGRPPLTRQSSTRPALTALIGPSSPLRQSRTRRSAAPVIAMTDTA